MSLLRPPTPAAQVREHLVVCRRAGMDFESSWYAALRRVKWPHDTTARRQWRDALSENMGEFQAAYEGRPTEAGHWSAALLAALEPGDGVDPNEYDLIAA